METMITSARRAVGRKKRLLLIVIGAIQVGAGGMTAVAPHLATVLGPRAFAVAMIVTGIGSTMLAFVRSELAQEP